MTIGALYSEEVTGENRGGRLESRHTILSFNNCVIFLMWRRESPLTSLTAFCGLVGEQLCQAHKSLAICRRGEKNDTEHKEISKD